MAQIKILIIEDELITALALQVKLQEFGYQIVDIVSSGRDAFISVQRLKPDIILSDMQIKGSIDGLQTVDLLKRRYGIPYIILSADSDEATLDRIQDSDALGFFSKPVTISKLNDLISRHRIAEPAPVVIHLPSEF